ncbi:LOW QUALITY PROTEIN: uncharacterized protein LOC111079067 [Drosophila obscura]|uniref:LOW QUALITY PROTEIN: uncharacterized protein LOC111079067 n=1 Tax=Drosophila obscura TaxID=7282 RepID=UPI001BB0F3FB|nr:LOW QUALITY PROTEIN: uncharacterized protein LOC111079067 [Drosophila obscura]
MKSLRKELPFRSILLLRNEKDADSCWTREDFDQDIPILNLNANQGVYLKKIFNSEMLAMVCVNRSEGDTMKALYRNLQDIRYTPTIIMTRSDTNLSALFEDCRSHKMLNVLALKDSDREFVYSYRAFPRLQVVKRRVLHIRRYIEPQVKNMEGYQINVLPDNIMPRSVVYRDAQGRRRMTGYLAHLIRNFVGTLNATMHICWDYVPEEEIIDKMTMLNLSNGGAVDFPLVFTNLDEFGTNSIVLEQASWFLMLPMEANTPRARLFYRMEVYKLMPMIILLALVLSFVQRLEKGLGPSDVPLGHIVKSLRKELPFRSILLLRNEKDADSCWTREDFDQDIPILILNANQGVCLKKIFNSEMLAMVCVNRSEGDTMKALYRNLQDIRYTPTIIMTQSDTNLSALFEDCRSHKMLNVLALKDSDREFVYSYRAFPRLQVVKRRVLHIRRYVEPQVKNMEGYQINVLPDNIMPRSVVYRDAQGRRRMTGYLAHLIRNFVGTLNATMHICWDYVPEEETTNMKTVVGRSKDGSVDIPLVVTSLGECWYDNVVMEMSSWFLILPMEANIPRAHLFYIIKVHKLIPIVLLLALVLSNVQRLEAGLAPSVSLGIIWDYVLRGFLAQPFVLPYGLSPRLMLIYGLLFLHTMTISNIFNVNLESGLVHPPIDRQILSFQDMRLGNLKILVIPAEFTFINKTLGAEQFGKIVDIFEITNSSKIFQLMRSSLNPAYAYPITTTLWPLLQLSQARLTRPIFRRSREIEFSPVMILALPLPRNSIYLQAFSNFVLNAQASGLYRYWFRKTFNELICMHKINYNVDNSTQPYQDLMWKDFYFIWLAYIGGTFASLLTFLGEVLYNKWRQGGRHD